MRPGSAAKISGRTLIATSRRSFVSVGAEAGTGCERHLDCPGGGVIIPTAQRARPKNPRDDRTEWSH
jgi:hypothetical protein